jgi:hypothetical protein
MVQELRDTLLAYSHIDREDIQYTYCHDYNHISRYKNLRQVIHEGSSDDRCITLETSNAFSSTLSVSYYVVPASRENRLDLIAEEKLGSAKYAWVLAYFNNIEDGFTVPQGSKLAIPPSISSLFESGECLAPISATKLNLGSE